MVSKKKLLKNPDAYSAQEIAEAIRAGVVTMYELMSSGRITPGRRREIEEAVSAPVVNPLRRTDTPYAGGGDAGGDADDDDDDDDDDDTPSTDEEKTVYYDDPSFTNRGFFRRPFSFKGRIRRREYLISAIIANVLSGICNLASESAEGMGALVVLLLWIPILWFIIAQCCKRCHDLGHNGWWQLIPFYGIIMLFIDSEPGENEYGDNPKGNN